MELLSKSSRTKNKSTDKREIYLDLSKWFPLIGTKSIFIAELNYLAYNIFEKKIANLTCISLTEAYNHSKKESLSYCIIQIS